MPWFSPRTWVAAEVLTAALLNAQVRDNLAWLGEPPRARVRLTNTKTPLNGGTNTDISPVTVIEDTAGAVSAAAGTFTVPAGAGGLYLITWSGRLENASGGNGSGRLAVWVNAAVQTPGLDPGASNAFSGSAARTFRLAAGDVVKIAFTGVGGTTSTVRGNNDGYDTGFEITRLTV